MGEEASGIETEAEGEPEERGDGLSVDYELVLEFFDLDVALKRQVVEVFRAVKEAIDFFGYGVTHDELAAAIELFGAGLEADRCRYYLEFLINIGVFRESSAGLDGGESREICAVLNPECEFLVPTRATVCD